VLFHDPNGPVHANGFTNMLLLTELEFLWEWVFYKYIAPTALGCISKLPLEKAGLRRRNGRGAS
jgi:hypothetical protein